MAEQNLIKQAISPSKAKSSTSKLAIASFVSCVLAIFCMIIYLYYEEVFLASLNYLFLQKSSILLVRFQEKIFENICLMLPVISVLLGIAAIIRIALSSKRRKGYILAIASIVLVLIASFLCVVTVLSQIGTIC